jgi:hypothetical protein
MVDGATPCASQYLTFSTTNRVSSAMPENPRATGTGPTGRFGRRNVFVGVGPYTAGSFIATSPAGAAQAACAEMPYGPARVPGPVRVSDHLFRCRSVPAPSASRRCVGARPRK